VEDGRPRFALRRSKIRASPREAPPRHSEIHPHGTLASPEVVDDITTCASRGPCGDREILKAVLPKNLAAQRGSWQRS